MMTKNGASALVDMLLKYQIEFIFGVPGDTSIGFYEALYDAQPGIQHVMARDERSASFMADAYARISRKPGVCECPSGAGPLYSVPGVAEANASSIPVILLTSDIPLSGEGKNTITELDTDRLFESITKWSYLVKDAAKIPQTIRRAFRIATTGRPGAVHLALPQEVLEGFVSNSDGDRFAEPECCSYPAYRTRGARSVLEQVRDVLGRAKRPVIIAGGGANHSQAEKALANLAELLAAPVVTTISGQGVIADEHHLAMGVIGDNGFHPHAHRCVEEADVLLYVGCKMGSVSTLNWSFPAPNPDRKIIQIDLNPIILGNNFQNAISVDGDAKLVLEDLVILMREVMKQQTPSDWVNALNQDRQSFWEAFNHEQNASGTPIKPQKLIGELNRHLTNTSIVIADAGTPTPYITRYLKLGGNGSRFLIPRSYGGLGYAIPAVVGAHFARPDARLVGLFGDGSLGMSAGELETIARLKIPVVLIHCNNAMFGWIKALQKLHSKEKYFSVDFTAGDPALVAEGFGLKSFRVENTADLDVCLDKAFASDRPVFLDVNTESEVSELPPVYSWLKTAGKQ